MVRAWITSGQRFLWGIAKRWWAWAVGLVIAAFDVLAFVLGEELTVPNWAVWTLLGIGLAIAAIGTFHEARMEGVRATASLTRYRTRRGASLRLADQQARGNGLTQECDAVDAQYDRLVKEFDAWCAEARDVLLTVAPEYVPEFERDGGAPYAYAGPRQMSNLKVRLDGRLERLGRIVDRVSAYEEPSDTPAIRTTT